MAKRAIDLVGLKNAEYGEVLEHLVEVELTGTGAEGENIFRRVRETLERIGVTSDTEPNTLYQACHILHKKGKYYIAHYKCLYALDGGDNRTSRIDIARQNRTIGILSSWGMVKVKDASQIEGADGISSGIKILRHDQKADWILKEKYDIAKIQPPSK